MEYTVYVLSCLVHILPLHRYISPAYMHRRNARERGLISSFRCFFSILMSHSLGYDAAFVTNYLLARAAETETLMLRSNPLISCQLLHIVAGSGTSAEVGFVGWYIFPLWALWTVRYCTWLVWMDRWVLFM